MIKQINVLAAMAVVCLVLTRAEAMTEKQKAKEWEAMGSGLYIHYGLTTFADLSHPRGELIEPSEFRIKKVDVERWAKVAKDAGAGYALLTVKHEYGFCLWDSKDYKYDIGNSPAKDLDIIGDYIEACKSEGIKPGIHYSVCDLYNEGQYRKFKGAISGGYFTRIKQQTEELHKKYPDIAIHRFDVAGRFSPEQRGDLYALIKELSPDCIVNICRYPKKTDEEYVFFMPSPGLPADAFEPKVADVTILRPWFWTPNYVVTPAEELFRRYQAAQESKASFVVNVGPDRYGRIPTDQLEELKSLAKMIAADEKKKR